MRLNIETEDASHPVLVETERQFEEYFAGQRKEFALRLDVAGTPFQRKVWNALLTIPFGETRSYGEIARQIGNPDAVRAVGAANGRNPVSIVTPCHRVIGSTGKLTGFGGGLDVKARLLPGGRDLAESFDASTRGELKQPLDQISRHRFAVRLVHQLVAGFRVRLRRNGQALVLVESQQPLYSIAILANRIVRAVNNVNGERFGILPTCASLPSSAFP